MLVLGLLSSLHSGVTPVGAQCSTGIKLSPSARTACTHDDDMSRLYSLGLSHSVKQVNPINLECLSVLRNFLTLITE